MLQFKVGGEVKVARNQGMIFANHADLWAGSEWGVLDLRIRRSRDIDCQV